MYTVRETDVVLTDITPLTMSQVTKATIPGRYPLLLVGKLAVRRPSTIVQEMPAPVHRKFIVCATRDGKGIVVASNDTYKTLSTKEVSDFEINVQFVQDLIRLKIELKTEKNNFEEKNVGMTSIDLGNVSRIDTTLKYC